MFFRRSTTASHRSRRGFTLVELLVSIGIIVILAGVSFLALQRNRSTSELKAAMQQMVTVIRGAQSRAVSQASSTTWGVYFANATATRPFFALFSSTTYTTATQVGTYPLPPSVTYVVSTLASGATTSVIFSVGTGQANAAKTISLVLKNNPAVSSTLTIATSGLITY